MAEDLFGADPIVLADEGTELGQAAPQRGRWLDRCVCSLVLDADGILVLPLGVRSHHVRPSSQHSVQAPMAAFQHISSPAHKEVLTAVAPPPAKVTVLDAPGQACGTTHREVRGVRIGRVMDHDLDWSCVQDLDCRLGRLGSPGVAPDNVGRRKRHALGNHLINRSAILLSS